MWALNVQQSWRTSDVCAHPSYTPAGTPGDQQVVHTTRQVPLSASRESVRSGRPVITCHDYGEREPPLDGVYQRTRLEMSDDGEVPTIFHPRRSLTNLALGEDQRTYVGLPIQVALSGAGKFARAILRN